MNYFFKTVIFIALVHFNFVNAQNFQGVATYELKLVENATPKFIDDTSAADDVQHNKLIEGMKVFAKRKRTFELTFNKNESVYQEQEQLDLPSASTKGIVIKMASTGFGKAYKNLTNKQQVLERDLYSKEFLIAEPLEVIDWKLESETKKIGNFICFKATAILPVSEDEREAYEKRTLKQEQKVSLFLNVQKPEPKIITVWYSPEIPVNHGPAKLWGLPGLILEVNDGKTITLCSKVVLNPKGKLKIASPKKGTVLTQKQYNALENEKNEEMKNRNRN
jgi:GLPGLI family protein